MQKLLSTSVHNRSNTVLSIVVDALSVIG